MRQDKASHFLDYNLVNSFRNLLIMETKEFKTMFGKIAKSNGFKFLYGGWYKESSDCIVVLELQRSNYSILYYLNIKIYIRGAYGQANIVDKNIIKNRMGNLLTRQPNEYNDCFNLETCLDDNARRARLEELFKNYINPLTEKALCIEKIIHLVEEKKYPYLSHLYSSQLNEEIEKKIAEKAAKAKNNAEEQ